MVDDDRIILKLTGSEAHHGLPWANLASFVDDIRRALREYDRQRQGAVPARGGHPSGREDQVTSFRLVSFKPGSAIMELEPIPPKSIGDDEAHPVIAEAEQLAVENLRSFVDSLESPDSALDSVVTDAIDEARRRLGEDGKMESASADRKAAGVRLSMQSRSCGLKSARHAGGHQRGTRYPSSVGVMPSRNSSAGHRSCPATSTASTAPARSVQSRSRRTSPPIDCPTHPG